MRFKKAMQVGLVTIFGVVFSVSAVYACHPWINANKYRLEEGNTLRFHFALGHNYPFGHSFYDNAEMEHLYMLSPEGKRCEIGQRTYKGKLSMVQFESRDELKKGTYLVVMESKPHFLAKTTKGYRYKSKAELKDKEIIGKVKFSQNLCKAIASVGQGGGEGCSKILGHGLEIVPLKDPNELRTNDFLPIQILHNGKPLKESVKVYATYIGFSNDTDVFAYTCWASASREGKAKIRILQPGIWMVFVSHKFPYPDSKLADVYSYQSTLTFEVKP